MRAQVLRELTSLTGYTHIGLHSQDTISESYRPRYKIKNGLPGCVCFVEVPENKGAQRSLGATETQPGRSTQSPLSRGGLLSCPCSGSVKPRPAIYKKALHDCWPHCSECIPHWRQTVSRKSSTGRRSTSQERKAAITEAEGLLMAGVEVSNPLPSSKCLSSQICS